MATESLQGNKSQTVERLRYYATLLDRSELELLELLDGERRDAFADALLRKALRASADLLRVPSDGAREVPEMPWRTRHPAQPCTTYRVHYAGPFGMRRFKVIAPQPMSAETRKRAEAVQRASRRRVVAPQAITVGTARASLPSMAWLAEE